MTEKLAASKFPRLLSLSSETYSRLSKTHKHHRTATVFKRTSCHLGIFRPLVSDGEGLHVRTFAANIFNNQSQMAERGRFPSRRIERGTKLLTVYIHHVTFLVQKKFSNGKNSSIYTWNVGIFCRTDYLETVSRQLGKYE